MANSPIERALSFDLGEIRREIQDVDIRRGAAERGVERMIDRFKIAQRQVQDLEIYSKKLESFAIKNVAKGAIASSLGSLFTSSSFSADDETQSAAGEFASAAKNVAVTAGATLLTTGNPGIAAAAAVIATINELKQIQSRYQQQLEAAEKATNDLRKRLTDHVAETRRQKLEEEADRRRIREEVQYLLQKKGEVLLHQAAGFLGAGDDF